MINDVLVYMPLKGARAQPQGGASRGYNPKVTIWSGITEAPDETAHGEWMHIMATMGLEVDKALLNYLAGGKHKVERKGSTFWGGMQLSMDRPRPPKSEEDSEEPNQ